MDTKNETTLAYFQDHQKPIKTPHFSYILKIPAINLYLIKIPLNWPYSEIDTKSLKFMHIYPPDKTPL